MGCGQSGSDDRLDGRFWNLAKASTPSDRVGAGRRGVVRALHRRWEGQDLSISRVFESACYHVLLHSDIWGSQSNRCSCDAACGVALTLLDVHSTYAYGDVDPSMDTSFIRRGGG